MKKIFCYDEGEGVDFEKACLIALLADSHCVVVADDEVEIDDTSVNVDCGIGKKEEGEGGGGGKGRGIIGVEVGYILI